MAAKVHLAPVRIFYVCLIVDNEAIWPLFFCGFVTSVAAVQQYLPSTSRLHLIRN